MQYIKTPLPGVLILKPLIFADARGFFLETWRENTFQVQVGAFTFVQDNQSHSKKNTLRGLHYQVNQVQGKLVRCVRGRIFDVAVDIRQDSSSCGQWFGYILAENDQNQLWVPPGFAHGFYVLSEEADVVYKCTDYYSAKDERCIIWNDPDLAIEWPLVDKAIPPLLSEKDSNGLAFVQAELL